MAPGAPVTADGNRTNPDNEVHEPPTPVPAGTSQLLLLGLRGGGGGEELLLLLQLHLFVFNQPDLVLNIASQCPQHLPLV